ncbi:MAG: endonuclease/exonuclease/phosphatase family protein [Proteobacteria bacterium]|nr:endonuclease/exonuclease/phosphatase family protein [Pseudomonadota bacterium]
MKLLTLNLAHGRKDSLNQWLVSAEQIRQNLDEVAAYLMEVGADVVALQEADGPSRWSGNFDHVAYLAEKSGFRYSVYAEHAQISMGNYGTAILSKWPIVEAQGLTYPDSPPTASKGFTLATVAWQRAGEVATKLDIISVHLDFSRKSVRLQQIDELAEVLSLRDNAIAIMGDFNSEWLAKEYMVENSGETKRLYVYQPDSDQLSTYKAKRLDWILLSHDLVFESYEVEQRLLSDHKAVVADIALSCADTKPL